MSDLFPLFDDDDALGADGGGAGSGDGRRSLWTVLTVLVFALIVVVGAVFLLRSTPGPRPDSQLAGPSDPGTTSETFSVSDTATQSVTPSPTQSAHSTSPLPSSSARTSAKSSKSPTPTPSTSHSATPSRTRTPTPTPSTSTTPNGYCHSSSPCVYPGDNGGVTALETYLHPPNGAGQQGYIDSPVQQCAVQEARGTPCSGAHAYTIVPTQDGSLAISRLTHPAPSWFADSDFKSFLLGWAYWPGHGYVCEIEKSTQLVP